MGRYVITKTFEHCEGIYCTYRIHKSLGKEKFLHGYPMSIKLVFESFDLNESGWIIDRSIFDEMKELIKTEFDGKTCVAGDDPEIETFNQLHEKQIIDLKIMEMVSQEKFAEAVHGIVTAFLEDKTLNNTVILRTVEVREHQGDSAIYLN